jgi:iron complex transport system ATP-binding protein
LLAAADVTFAYNGSPVVRGVSLDVPAGAFLGILGPNGSGKTTLLRLLAGSRRPASGRVTLDGTDLARVPRASIARRLALVPQETHLAFEYTALELVLMGRYPHLGAFEIEGPRDLEIARRSLEATGTLDLQDRLFDTLSGGEKQRVVIASALAQIGAGSAPATGNAASPVLLLDEPTAALDLAYQLEIASLLRALRASLGVTIVVSTHDLNFAASLCSTIVLLKQGHILAQGPIDDVITPAHIRTLYGVEADVERRESTGHLAVIPVRRSTT